MKRKRLKRSRSGVFVFSASTSVYDFPTLPRLALRWHYTGTSTAKKMKQIADMQLSFSLTSPLSFDRWIKLWLIVARCGEMDMTCWWNTQGCLVSFIAQIHLQGTTYYLHYSNAFLHMVTADDETVAPAELPTLFLPSLLPGVPAPEPVTALPDWIDREHWGWLAPEAVQRLVARAGSEAQAREKLAIILYNETHGPEERRVRDRRAVLAHYLRTPHADIWPNDDGYETLPLQQARLERDRALQEKALVEEALRARQEAAKARFLASLAETQLQWLKCQAKARVDGRPDAKFLQSRYPLYKAEEEELLTEWRDRVAYGETVPHITTEYSGDSESPDA
jgi:hypothetical protein